MNNKGFTLVELLATIILLSLVLMIAVTSTTKVSNAIRENQKKNLIVKLEIAASKYAFDTAKTVIFVDELVTDGYVDVDNEYGFIIDPVSNEKMNCYVITMEKTSDYYEATFNEDKNYNHNGSCDFDRLQEESAEVMIETSNSSGVITNTSNWFIGNDISLKAKWKNDGFSIDCKVDKCAWSSSSGINTTGKDRISLKNINGVSNTKYTFQITFHDNISDTIKRYSSSVILKIDNESPTIFETNISDKLINTDNKKVTITASDGKGSGINGYYLAIDNGITCNDTSIQFNTSNEYTVDENGTYLLCVKDNAGNITSSNVVVSNIN